LKARLKWELVGLVGLVGLAQRFSRVGRVSRVGRGFKLVGVSQVK
jgi:hypothetical protein